jgi:hypothetical protein
MERKRSVAYWRCRLFMGKHEFPDAEGLYKKLP